MKTNITIVLIILLALNACKKQDPYKTNAQYQIDSIQIITKNGYDSALLKSQKIIISRQYWDNVITDVNSGFTKNLNDIKFQFGYNADSFIADTYDSKFYSYSFKTGNDSYMLNFTYQQNKLDSINYSSVFLGNYYKSRGKVNYLNSNINLILSHEYYSNNNDTIRMINFNYSSVFPNQKSLIGIDLNDIILNAFIKSYLFKLTPFIPNYDYYENGLLLNSYFSYNMNNKNLIEKIQMSSYSIIVSYSFDITKNNRVEKMTLIQKNNTITDLITDYIFYYKD